MNEETKELSTHLIKEHITIADLFTDKVIALLNSPIREFNDYSIRNHSYGKQESLSVKVGKVTINLQISHDQ